MSLSGWAISARPQRQIIGQAVRRAAFAVPCASASRTSKAFKAECASEYCIEYTVHAIEARMLSRVYQVRQRGFKKMGYLFIRRSPPPPTILSNCTIAPSGVGATAKLLLQLFSADRSPSADFRTHSSTSRAWNGCLPLLPSVVPIDDRIDRHTTRCRSLLESNRL